jgi:predicted PhzF superfamily epimerase YddE/YHI9
MANPLFQVDAFTDRRFSGNPAAVMLMHSFPSDDVLQAIAAENNLAETAFLVPDDGDYHLRWFTPATEVPLCGHATLASAAVVMERIEPGRTAVIFHTASGPLPVKRAGKGYVMDFPVRLSESVPPPSGLAEALGVVPVEVFVNRFNYMVLLDSPSTGSLAAPLSVLVCVWRLTRNGNCGASISSCGPPKGSVVRRQTLPYRADCNGSIRFHRNQWSGLRSKAKRVSGGTKNRSLEAASGRWRWLPGA